MLCVPAVRARTALTIFRKLRGCKTGTQAQLGNFLVRAVSHCYSWGYLGLKEGAHLPRVGGGGVRGMYAGSTNDRLRLREFYQYDQPCVGSSAAGVVAWRASRGSVSRGIVTAS